MRARDRTVKNVSFAHNEYELGLLDYATRPERGPFSVYIKQLIERDRAGSPPPRSAMPQPPREESQKARSQALDFL